MDIQRKAFELSNNVNPDWSFKFDAELQQYIAIDGEMGLQVDEFNEHWDTFRAGWQARVPEGYKLMPIEINDEIESAMFSSVARGEMPCDIYKAMIGAQESKG